jgi:hypothetical protein
VLVFWHGKWDDARAARRPFSPARRCVYIHWAVDGQGGQDSS